MDPQTPAPPRFQHVTITFTPGEEPTLRRFYLDLLGFREKPVPRSAKALGWIWFQTGQEGVELHCVPDPKPVPDDSTHHFCLQIDDLEGCRARLRHGGHAIREARPLPFRPRFFTRDPFNNLIEIVRVEGDYVAAGEAAE
ncbi:MAG: VOC family protein [Verrucomicrobia bacterium]|nr:VOC family protein [Verrucomicrobiota bacterium]